MNDIKQKLLSFAFLCAIHAENAQEINELAQNHIEIDLTNKNIADEDEDLFPIDEDSKLEAKKNTLPAKKEKKQLTLLQKIAASCKKSLKETEKRADRKANLKYTRDLLESSKLTLSGEGDVNKNKSTVEIKGEIDLGNIIRVFSQRVIFTEFSADRIALISKQLAEYMEYAIEYVFVTSKIKLAESHQQLEYLDELNAQRDILISLLKNYKLVNFAELDKISTDLTIKPNFTIDISDKNVVAPSVSEFNPFWDFTKTFDLKFELKVEQKQEGTEKDYTSTSKLSLEFSPARMFGPKAEGDKKSIEAFDKHIAAVKKTTDECRKAFFDAQRKLKALESVDSRDNNYVAMHIDALDKMMEFYLKYAKLMHKNGRLVKEIYIK